METLWNISAWIQLDVHILNVAWSGMISYNTSGGVRNNYIYVILELIKNYAWNYMYIKQVKQILCLSYYHVQYYY